jgi:hypothetical protein
MGIIAHVGLDGIEAVVFNQEAHCDYTMVMEGEPEVEL